MLGGRGSPVQNVLLQHARPRTLPPKVDPGRDHPLHALPHLPHPLPWEGVPTSFVQAGHPGQLFVPLPSRLGLLFRLRWAGVRHPFREAHHLARTADLLWSDVRVRVHGDALIHAGRLLEDEETALLRGDTLRGEARDGAALPFSHRTAMRRTEPGDARGCLIWLVGRAT